MFLQDVRALLEVSRHDLLWPDNFPGGIKGMVKAVLKKAQDQFADDERQNEKRPEAGSVEDRQGRLEDALMNFAGKQKPKWVIVDMEKKLHELGLDWLFPEEVRFVVHTNFAMFAACVLCRLVGRV